VVGYESGPLLVYKVNNPVREATSQPELTVILAGTRDLSNSTKEVI